MTGAAPGQGHESKDGLELFPLLLGAIAFAWLFYEPFFTLLRDWWNDPEAGHGLLLGPLAVYLIWKSGLAEKREGQQLLGVLVLIGAVMLRLVSALAAELFTMRMSMLFAAAGLVVFVWGLPQIRRWWLPVSLLVLSVPLPSVVVSTLALPLQLQASQMGASLLEWRDVPVLLNGNVIHLPGQALFVTEACSGLRSITALLSLGLLMGGLWLQKPAIRGLLLAITIPVAVVVNSWRIFFTGFLVFFVDPSLGDGFMHYTEGWVLFIVAFMILSGLTWALRRGELWVRGRFTEAQPVAAS